MQDGNWGRLALVGGALLGVLVGGCGSDDTEGVPAKTCPYSMAGSCVGVPLAPVCSADTCAGGVTCSETHEVASQAELDAIATTAAPGSCIVLAPGSYGAITLAGGVSVLGRGADFVSVAGITEGDGGAPVIRGLALGNGGLALGGTDALVDRVRVSKASANGISVGSSASIVDSEVVGSGAIGVAALGAAKIELKSSAIVDSTGPGLVAGCDDGCTACSAEAALDKVLLEGNAHVGASLNGATATFDGVQIHGTKAKGLEANSGGGLVVSECAALTATALEVSDSDFFGILVDSASAHLGTQGEVNGIIIHANVLGLWFQGTNTTGELDGCVVTENEGVGIGTGGETNGIIIHASQIKGTASKTMVVTDGGSKQVGDGLIWTGGAKMVIDGLTVSSSARQGILIDGSVATGSSIANVKLEGGDEKNGILQQSLETGGVEPDVGASAPPIASNTMSVFSVPVPPAIPQ